MKTLGDFKRGDTFAFYANLTDHSTGLPITIAINLMKCQVRNASNKLYGELIISAHPTVVGRYLFEASREVTALWPATMAGTLLYIDVEMEIDGITSSTETFTVNVLQDISKVVV